MATKGSSFGEALPLGCVTAVCGLVLVLTPLGTTFERTFGLDWLFKMRGVKNPAAGRGRRGHQQRHGAGARPAENAS